MVLEEQRLTNGVLNSFFTEIERATTDASGVVELETVRSNVLSIRFGLNRKGALMKSSTSIQKTLTDGTPNVVEVSVMPQCLVTAEHRQHQFTLPWNYNINYKWTPREVDGAASDVRWTCDTDWQT